jgi:hypothetical protein
VIAKEIEDKLEPVCLLTFVEGPLGILVIPWVLWKFTPFLALISCLHRALKPIKAMGWHVLKSLCAVHTTLAMWDILDPQKYVAASQSLMQTMHFLVFPFHNFVCFYFIRIYLLYREIHFDTSKKPYILN